MLLSSQTQLFSLKKDKNSSGWAGFSAHMATHPIAWVFGVKNIPPELVQSPTSTLANPGVHAQV